MFTFADVYAKQLVNPGDSRWNSRPAVNFCPIAVHCFPSGER